MQANQRIARRLANGEHRSDSPSDLIEEEKAKEKEQESEQEALGLSNGEKIMKTELTTTETNRLAHLTAVVIGGLDGVFAVGLALREIRDSRLYRLDFETFEDFCRSRFDMDRTYAHRLVDAAEIKMLPIGNKIQNESQARAIAAVPEKEREDVMARVEAAGPVTAKAITAAAKEPVVAVELDKVGKEIPAKVLALWQRADSAGKESSDMISKIRSVLKAGQESDDPIFRELTLSSLQAALSNLYADLKRIRPHAVCYACGGGRSDKCRACKGRGFVSKHFYDICVPEEFKK